MFFALPSVGQTLPTGQIVADVKCAADPTESYALYLPTGYTTERSWPVILAFDPGARGRVPVERFQAAAEQYGFIVAGSNTSRNGRNNDAAVVAMAEDVLARFRVNERRVYMAGMSGGARVALGAALSSSGIAGVIASSGGFPDGVPRTSVAFPIFATAGSEDFNRLEMRRLDTRLTSPHRLVLFEGGHVWPSSELAIEAVEWMELHAMRTGLAPIDDEVVARLIRKRGAAAGAMTNGKDLFLALKAVVEDFAGLADTAAVAERAVALANDPAVRAALKEDADEDNRETDILLEMRAAEERLASAERAGALVWLGRRWKALSELAAQADDSRDRRLGRRVLGLKRTTLSVTDADYLKIVAEYGKVR
jgi:predicted esterase